MSAGRSTFNSFDTCPEQLWHHHPSSRASQAPFLAPSSVAPSLGASGAGLGVDGTVDGSGAAGHGEVHGQLEAISHGRLVWHERVNSS